jgi:hypothetical protein
VPQDAFISVRPEGSMPEQKELTGEPVFVAAMLHEIAAYRCKSLKRNENILQHLQHEKSRARELSR